jgi:hypothetical protein
MYFPVFKPAVGITLSLVWTGLVAGGAWLTRCGGYWAVAASAGTLVVTAAFFSLTPNTDRDWIPDQERAVRITYTGNTVKIDNLRDRVFGPDGSVESRKWYSDTFRIEDIERVDFVHEILSRRGLIAHGFLTFAFSDGRHLAVSVEARRTEGRPYHPLPGLFRNYELIYILGTETDLIGERVNVRKNPVYIYPIRTTQENVQALFQSVLMRADSLARDPEFYNSVANNCVTNILLHVNELTDRPFRLDTRILFPGLADRVIHERELLDYDGSRKEALLRFRINDRSAFVADSPEWSRQIRMPADPD